MIDPDFSDGNIIRQNVDVSGASHNPTGLRLLVLDASGWPAGACSGVTRCLAPALLVAPVEPGEIVEPTAECNVGDGAPALPRVSQGTVAHIQSRGDERLTEC